MKFKVSLSCIQVHAWWGRPRMTIYSASRNDCVPMTFPTLPWTREVQAWAIKARSLSSGVYSLSHRGNDYSHSKREQTEVCWAYASNSKTFTCIRNAGSTGESLWKLYKTHCLFFRPELWVACLFPSHPLCLLEEGKRATTDWVKVISFHTCLVCFHYRLTP